MARHKVITAIGVVLLIAMFANAAGGDTSNIELADTQASPSTAVDDATGAPQDPAPVEEVKVPDVEGLAIAKAEDRLEAAGFAVTVDRRYSNAEAGTILAVSPRPGSERSDGSVITLTVAEPYPRVPSVAGLGPSKAAAKLKAAGYKIRIVKQVSTLPPGSVVQLKPGAGSKLLPGKTVTIVVAKAPPTLLGGTGGGGGCHPSYSGACLDPNASDYDCAGGSGDGPLYTGYVQVVGPDEYGLDSDGDGAGCES
jgi:hypothetical protein